ncbi:MAG: DNA methyltransferase [Kiritimatiellia bacterium]
MRSKDFDKNATSDSPAVCAFIERWARSGAAERSNHQLFISELCGLIKVPHPDPATPDNSENAYVFERTVTFQDGNGKTSTGFIDLYKRGCFVLEAKQGADAPTEEPISMEAQELRRKLRRGHGQRGSGAWDDSMLRARGQADRYIRALATEEGRPPFLIVLDVGHSIELFSEFSCTGGTYIPFPAAGSHRIFLPDLQRPEIRERLKQLWTAPFELDPTRRSARVTRAIASQLAKLALSLERAGHSPEIASAFLMRCLFTMFAEDVGLLMRDGFTNLLESMRDTPEHFAPMVAELWKKMNTGGFSTSLRTNILQFNGGLFEDSAALELTKDQLLLLLEAAKSDWRDVEPAIFGTLLERALNPVERHKLGAHYTPRAYVERLVMPTVINPVREEWEAVHVAAVSLANQSEMKKAIAEVKKFHRKLVHIRILDPACGSGNFLYVTLEHLKRIEGEIFDALDSFGERQSVLELAGETVGPHQLLGIEVNPRAAGIAELVLRIGALQWHFRNRGNVQPAQPIIRNFRNIECRDALVEWESVETLLDADNNPITHWDGRTTKPHPITGKEVPDETARTPVYKYINPRKAEWPETDYIVGNPPFIGPALMRQALGDGYTDTVRKVHSDVGESSDFVMYWWNHAAKLARAGKIQRFGFITTNSLRQTFNRRVLETHINAKEPLSLLFAIPDHPWVDSVDGAAVRIAMTTASNGEYQGLLQHVISEHPADGGGYAVELDSNTGKIWSDLTIGADVAGALPLQANQQLSSRGVQLIGSGFIVTREQATRLGLGGVAGLDQHIRAYRNGRDLTTAVREVMVIDLFGLREAEVREQFPAVYQWVLERVKPERDQNKRKSYLEKWWIHGEPRGNFRPALAGLSRFIATVETSKHRFFTFLDQSILPDNRLINIATDDAYYLGILSSRIHVCWALATGAILGPTPVYNKTRCFETFPFPDASDEQRANIRNLAEQLDIHRKRQQEQHPELTMTGMYNVLEKLRSGEALAAKEKIIHEQGLISVLKQLHDELDQAVFAAYGWPATLSDGEILERLVALNAVRAREEAQGEIRWLRPEYQCPAGAGSKQGELAITESASPIAAKKQAKSAKRPWPKSLPEQVLLLREALTEQASPATAEAIARQFTQARQDRVEELLQTLVAVGQAREVGDGQFVSG